MATPRDYLAFRLWGPTASWGTIAVGEQRHTWSRPSRSAVLGLIAAALGYERQDQDAHAALERGLGVAVRVDRAGSPLRDYHTTQSPSQEGKRRWTSRYDEIRNAKSLNTILSERAYLIEQSVLVMLWLRPHAMTASLAEIAVRLEKPRFAPYLGRKASPLGIPLKPVMIPGAETLAAAFDAFDTQECNASKLSKSKHEASAAAAYRRPRAWLVPDLVRPAGMSPAAVWIGLDDVGSVESPFIGPYEIVERTERRDGVRDRRTWTFSDRAEIRVKLCLKEQSI